MVTFPFVKSIFMFASIFLPFNVDAGDVPRSLKQNSLFSIIRLLKFKLSNFTLLLTASSRLEGLETTK